MVQMSVDWMDLSRFAKPGRNSLFEQVFEEVLNGVEELDQPRERTGVHLAALAAVAAIEVGAAVHAGSRQDVVRQAFASFHRPARHKASDGYRSCAETETAFQSRRQR